jgi:bifunctional enzyme CysN/CysC
VGFSHGFDKIVEDYLDSQQIGLEDIRRRSGLGLKGDNITTAANTPWYHGPTLMGTSRRRRSRTTQQRPFRLPVQWVNRPNLDSAASPARFASGKCARSPRAAVGPREHRGADRHDGR